MFFYEEIRVAALYFSASRAPVGELFCEAFRPFGGVADPVAGFAGIFAQVVKLLFPRVVEFDQFPVARPHRAAPAAAVLPALYLEIPVERTFGVALSGAEQFVGDARPVGFESLGQRRSGQLAERRIEVVIVGRQFRDPSAANPSRLPDDHRFARAAFVKGSLAAAQRSVVGHLGRTAVVAREDHDRIVGDPQLFQFFDDHPYTVVDHFELSGEMRIVRFGQIIRRPFLVGIVFGVVFGGRAVAASGLAAEIIHQFGAGRAPSCARRSGSDRGKRAGRCSAR